MTLKNWMCTAVLLAILVGAPVAMADISNHVFDLQVSQGGNTVGLYQVDIGQGTWNPDHTVYTWTLNMDTPIVPIGGGAVVATLLRNDTFITITPPAGGARSDPQVNLNFSVAAGSAVTEFTINSALLTFPTMSNAQARASAAFTVTDGIDGDGATLLGLGTPAQPGFAYTTQYNGFIPGGATFKQLIPQVVAGPEGQATVSADWPGGGAYLPLAGPISDMSSQIHFTLSPNDIASGTSTFEIIPEPTGLLLVLAGLAGLRRR